MTSAFDEMNLKISVITPSFNSGTTIDKAISSVLDQDYTNYEHIIIDGGSTDNTIEILKEYPHLTWISEPDKGQANAMNKGFRRSHGEVIVFLNADDYFLCGAFSTVIPFFQQGHKFVVGDVVVQMPNEYFINVPAVELSDMIRHWETNAFPSNPVGYFYRREVQEAVPFDENLDCMMDLQFLFECASLYKFKKINALLGVYRYFEDTKTGSDQKKDTYWARENFRLVDKYLSMMSPEYQDLYEKMSDLGYKNRRNHQTDDTKPERNSAWKLRGKNILTGITRKIINSYTKKSLLHLPSSHLIQGKIENKHYQLKENDSVFLIYQMGKVGSSSIYKALKEHHLSSPVYQLHYLDPTSLQESVAWHNANNFSQLPEHLQVSEAMATFLAKDQDRVRWKIISLVRDPIALQCSMIFQNLAEAFSSALEEDNTRVNLQKAIELITRDLSDFQTRKSHFLNWFDNEIKEVFGIDVYRYPFNKEEGFSIINQGNVEILLIKFENLQECFTEAFFQFTGINDLQLPQANVGIEKEYGEDYKKLTRTLLLPNSLCKNIYKTKLTQHFYSQQEINKFMEQWSHG